MFHRSISILKACVPRRPHGLLKPIRVQQQRLIAVQTLPTNKSGHEETLNTREGSANPLSQHGTLSEHGHNYRGNREDDDLRTSTHTAESSDVTFFNSDPLNHAEEAIHSYLSEQSLDCVPNKPKQGTNTGLNRGAPQRGQLQHESQEDLQDREATHQNIVRSVVHWQHLFNALSFPENGNLSDARDSFGPERRLAASFIGSGDIEEIGHRSRQLLRGDRMLISSILAGCLAESARFILTALLCLKWIPGQSRTRAECLHYAQRLYGDEIKHDAYLQQLYNKELSKLRNPDRWAQSGIQSVHLDLLMRDLSTSDRVILINQFLKKYPGESAANMLYIADCFIRIGDADAALSVMRRLPRDEIDRIERPLIGRCIMLLRLDTVERTQSKHAFKILPALLEMGIQPNEIIHNIVIQNAVKEQLPGVAWDVFHYMQKEGITADGGTHLALLKDSFLTNNIHGLNEIMNAIHQRKDLLQNPYVVAYTMNLVRNQCFFDRQLNPQESLSHLLAIYDKAYDRAPLIKLGIIRSDTPMKKGILTEPGPAGLAFTLWSYVLVQRQPRHVTRLWQELQRLIDQGDRQILEAAKFDAFYSGFIIFYLRQEQTLSEGLTVLQYMLQINLAQPHNNTWNLAICTFVKYNFESTAERIRQIMVWRGVPIVGDTWQIMSRKYPRSEVTKKIQSMLEARKFPEDIKAALKAQREEVHSTDVESE